MLINPGQFKHKISIQINTAYTDDLGNSTYNWQDKKIVYAQINNLYGEEYWKAAAYGQETTVVFTIRWTADIDNIINTQEISKYRVVYKDVPYNVISVDNINYQNKLIKIKGINK